MFWNFLWWNDINFSLKIITKEKQIYAKQDNEVKWEATVSAMGKMSASWEKLRKIFSKCLELGQVHLEEAGITQHAEAWGRKTSSLSITKATL